MMKENRRFGLRTAVVLLAAVGAAQAGTGLRVRDLGTLGGTYSQGSAVDSEGNVVGVSTLTGDATSHAFLSRESEGPLKDLGVLFDGSYSSAQGIAREGGAIVGYSDTVDPIFGPVSSHPFLYHRGTMTDLGTLGGALGQANGVANNGRIVGSSLLSDQSTTHAFQVYKGNSMVLIDLGTLTGQGNSVALGVSTRGTYVAGESDTNTFDASGAPIGDAVLWDKQDHIIDLGGIGGTLATANAVNDWGVATGFGQIAGNVVTDAFVSANGKLVDIGTLGGSYAEGAAINNSGVVVGYSNTTGDSDVHAFVYTSAKGMVDLNTLIDPTSGWELTAAYGISNSGQIVGVGLINGEAHAFSLYLWHRSDE